MEEDRLHITIIGGGSVYTPELIEGVIGRWEELRASTITLMDVDKERLDTVGGLARRMLAAARLPVELVLSTDREEALRGADIVVTQIRVGGNAQRVLDETIPRRFGVIGQETTGPGGFAQALRTIPVLLSIAEDVHRLCSNAWLINFTNPSGVVTEALVRHGRVRALGLCNLPINMRHAIARLLGASPERITLDYVGLNHLSWVRGVHLDGQDVTARALSGMIATNRHPDTRFHPELVRALGLIPCNYLRYYYHRAAALEEQRREGKTRAEEVQEIERALLTRYADPQLTGKPPELEKRGGALYSTAAVSLVAAIVGNKNEVQIVNCRNGGALPDLPPDCVVEGPCLVSARGATPLASGPLPVAIRGLVQAVKAYEELVIEAAITGNRHTALLALLNHPLVPGFDAAKPLLDAILEANKQFLPQFFPEAQNVSPLR